MKKFLTVLVAAVLSGVAVVGTSSSADARWAGVGATVAGAVLGVTVAGATEASDAVAAGAIGAWAGDRAALRQAQ